MLHTIKNFLTCLVLLPSFCFSQQNNKEPFLDSAIVTAYSIYTSAIGGDSHLLNGIEYKDYNLHSYDIGHPYFMSDQWKLGSVDYDNEHFSNVELLYNTVRDKLLLNHPQGHFKLELIDEKLSAFSLHGHNFVKLSNDSLNDIKSGFYNLLYDGKTKVYCKQRKKVQENINSRNIITEFSYRPIYYIYKEGRYAVVRSKSAMLKVFMERKTMVRKNLSKLNIRFQKNIELALTESAKFFDESGK